MGLFETLMERLANKPAPPQAPQSVMPREAFPSMKLGRAVSAVEGVYPEMRNVPISMGDLTGQRGNRKYNASQYNAFTFPEKIQVSPLVHGASQEGIEGTLAHELQHVRQRNEGVDYQRELAAPYELRPSEVEAEMALGDYNKLKGYGERKDGYSPDYQEFIRRIFRR